ncbi:MAG: phosphate acyltransferase PlsX [Xanthomonadales bacterium]|nr:phosphate acyltransferase PlsX [Xanthomonadales bacterium]
MTHRSLPDAPIHLALDAGSGDLGAPVMVGAARDALRLDPGLHVTLFGRLEDLERASDRLDANVAARLACRPVETVLPADVGPVAAIRAGADSSLGAAMQQLAQGQAQACVSAGSTTALVALGVKMLGMLAGLKRPALMSPMPTRTGFTSVLDLGANLGVDATQLVQFAIMGSVACSHHGRAEPRIGLLNVGHESTKGHSVVREAHERLQQLPLNYHGFIEGNDIFRGQVDVAVCDGFAGNLVLKSGEGLALMLLEAVRAGFQDGWRARLGGWLARPALRRSLARFDPAQHNGAPLLGLNGVVVKSHGAADRRATLQAIREASAEASRRVPEQIQTLIKNYKAEELS